MQTETEIKKVSTLLFVVVYTTHNIFVRNELVATLHVKNIGAERYPSSNTTKM